MKTNTAPSAVQNPPAYFTKAALCTRWQISAMTVWRWCRQGKLKPLKFGRGVRFAAQDVAEFEAQIGA